MKDDHYNVLPINKNKYVVMAYSPYFVEWPLMFKTASHLLGIESISDTATGMEY